MSNETPESLLNDVEKLPGLPGVYRFFDEAGQILYVGKANDLKNASTVIFSAIYRHRASSAWSPVFAL